MISHRPVSTKSFSLTNRHIRDIKSTEKLSDLLHHNQVLWHILVNAQPHLDLAVNHGTNALNVILTWNDAI